MPRFAYMRVGRCRGGTAGVPQARREARFSGVRLPALLPELALHVKILEVELGYLLLEVIFVVVGLASLLVGV